MSAINIIGSHGGLTELVDAASQSGWVAMDTEFLRERTFIPELCLIQATCEGFEACIDPLALDDLSPLGDLLANPAILKIFHSCRQDLEALDTRTTIQAANLYDTQLAAAFCGYGDQVSYGQLVDEICAVHLPKTYTRADWRRRPLPSEQLEYAIDDVKYLPPLRRQLDQLLEQKGRSDWHRAECNLAIDPVHYRFDPHNAWSRLKGVGSLDSAGRTCAQKLAAWREQKAHDRNLPRGWVLPPAALLQICRERPDTPEKLAEIPEIGARMLKHAGHEILAIVRQSKNDGDETTWSPPPMLTSEQRRRVKKIMAFLGQQADQAEISRSLFTNRREIEDFVRGETDLPLFKGWRAQLAGDEILARYA